MKVSKCSESKAEPKLLTFEQIKEQEGVYYSQNFASTSTRLIVIKPYCGKDTHAILYYAPDKKQVLSENTGWDSFKFIRTNETLCMEVRPWPRS
jgi:hypothetical protein